MLSDELIDALRELQSVEGNADGSPLTFYWAGAEYAAVAGQDHHGKTLSIGGFATDSDLTLVLIRSDFGATVPALKQTGNYPGQTGAKYRIDDITYPPGTGFIVLGLTDPGKGA